MKKRNVLQLLILLCAVSFLLAACGGSSDEGDNNDNEGVNGEDATEEATDDFTVAMVTDTGGIDDKSFNQSAWEGLQAWGDTAGVEKGSDGFDYAQSEDDSDYLPNFTRLVKNDFDLVF